MSDDNAPSMPRDKFFLLWVWTDASCATPGSSCGFLISGTIRLLLTYLLQARIYSLTTSILEWSLYMQTVNHKDAPRVFRPCQVN